VKKLLVCWILGLAVVTTNVAIVGCGGTDKKAEEKKEDKDKKPK